MRIVFMGTPDFAVPTLKSLNESTHEVVGVFTQTDKAVGRKQIITPPPVKEYASLHNLKVFQPKTLRDGSALEIIKELAPDIIVVVAYCKILPKEILDFPKYKCINGHASLLPRHRGASPIQWSIVCGDTVTGVSTQIMGEGIDTGDVLLSVKTSISDTETAETLHDRLSVMCADLILKTLDGIENNTIVPIKQDNELSNYAPILTKEMGQIDFSKTASEIHNLVRGFFPWPSAYFMLNGKRVKVLETAVSDLSDKDTGVIIKSDNKLVVSCGDGTSIELIKIQPEGSKPMLAVDYLKGHSLSIGLKI